ncbi:HrpT family type III secretion system protein [Candidatus Pantoea floridensis]|nr:HrpT family type III secretion system protein [Pantoea floridensis]
MILSSCASHDNGCDNTSCRPLSDPHHLVIWWPQSMREGIQSYSKMPVR